MHCNNPNIIITFSSVAAPTAQVSTESNVTFDLSASTLKVAGQPWIAWSSQYTVSWHGSKKVGYILIEGNF